MHYRMVGRSGRSEHIRDFSGSEFRNLQFPVRAIVCVFGTAGVPDRDRESDGDDDFAVDVDRQREGERLPDHVGVCLRGRAKRFREFHRNVVFVCPEQLGLYLG